MQTILSNQRLVAFHFEVEHKAQGEHRTRCFMTAGRTDDSEPVTSVLTEARSLPDRRYNKALDKAVALDKACHLLFPGPHNRPCRKRIWGTFYRCLRTPDIAVLSGAPRYIPPSPPAGPAPRVGEELRKINEIFTCSALASRPVPFSPAVPAALMGL